MTQAQKWADEAMRLKNENVDLQAINAQLLEALKPFAECADFIGTHSLSMKDETGLWTPFSSRGEQPPGILVSHVRAASAAIKAATKS